MADEVVDVLIVGAGLSGIGAACHLQRECPDRRFAILEARQDIGGTWDLFRYPGIRSDSDMYTLGYDFKPWTGAKAIADGPSIMAYLRETVAENDLRRHMRFGHRVVAAAWSSADAQWTVTARRDDGQTVQIRCQFLLTCGGYYDYAQGHTPEFPGRERFTGPLIHPQHWPEGLDLTGKRVVVIGSGATAVTLIPELAKQAALVTMLQRSPTYMATRPSADAVADWLHAKLGPRRAHAITRWKNVLWGMFIYRLAKRRPDKLKQRLIDMATQQLPAGYDVARHFTPRYNPWDQRLCLVPDGDLFKAIRAGKAEVVTDQIASFTERGIQLASGAELPADVIVTATGLKLKVMTGLQVQVDERTLDPAQLVTYKGLMFGGVPNFASVFGYTNASWTLKADLSCRFVCRLLNHLKKTGTRQCVPVQADPAMKLEPWVDFSSGYFQRVIDQLPKQGSAQPWKLSQNYITDLVTLRHGSVEDGVLRFSS
ncbi:MAG: NAD(P)/FAD-dependent oxidoreductase [Ideonella sp.]|nr:NAD(P)/FAD-dependent oxidoreductase [Ideonella sp.]